MTTPRDSYAWNYRELTTLLTLSESLAEVGLEPVTIGSMRKNLTIELSYQFGLSKVVLDMTRPIGGGDMKGTASAGPKPR